MCAARSRATAAARGRGRPSFCPITPRDVRLRAAADAYGMEVVVNNVRPRSGCVAPSSRPLPRRLGRRPHVRSRRANARRPARSASPAPRIDRPDGDPAKWSGKRYCLSVWFLDSLGRVSAKPATATSSPCVAAARAAGAHRRRERLLRATELASHGSQVDRRSRDRMGAGRHLPGIAAAVPVDHRSVGLRGDGQHRVSRAGRRPLVLRDLVARPFGHLSAPAEVHADIPGNVAPQAGFTVSPQPGDRGPAGARSRIRRPTPRTRSPHGPGPSTTSSSGGANNVDARSPTTPTRPRALYEATLKITDAGGLTSEASFMVEVAPAAP